MAHPLFCQLSSPTRPGAPAGSTPAMCANACQAIVPPTCMAATTVRPQGATPNATAAFPHARADAGHPSPTDSPRPAYRSPSSVAAAWYSPGQGTFPVSTPFAGPLAHSAHPHRRKPWHRWASLCTTRHARALARACVVSGGSPRGCHGLYTADLVPSRPSGRGSRRPRLLAGLPGRITRPGRVPCTPATACLCSCRVKGDSLLRPVGLRCRI